MNKKIIAAIAILMAITVGALGFQVTSAGTMFVIVLGSQDVGGSGWFAGYVVNGQSGTYTLRVSASGSEKSFPISDVKVIVLVSDEAASGGIQSLSINNVPVSGFTKGTPSYYGANGGPFSETDYYGYNDNYSIPQLSYSQGHYPDTAQNITVNLQFSSLATVASKVMFLCYGTDAKGQALKTAFSNGILMVVPEYALGGLVGLGACFVAFAIFKKRYKPSFQKSK